MSSKSRTQDQEVNVDELNAVLSQAGSKVLDPEAQVGPGEGS